MPADAAKPSAMASFICSIETACLPGTCKIPLSSWTGFGFEVLRFLRGPLPLTLAPRLGILTSR